MLDDELLFTVTDLKQFGYCRRVVFYEQCLPLIRPKTYKMKAGEAAHERERKRADRRDFSAYGLPEGERLFNVALTSLELGLTGEVDEVVLGPDGEVFPVDYKLAKQASRHYRIQLTAYALLLEADRGTVVRRGFIYLIPKRQYVEVKISPGLRTETLSLLEQMRRMVAGEIMPEAAANLAYCVSCEFRRFCNDV